MVNLMDASEFNARMLYGLKLDYIGLRCGFLHLHRALSLQLMLHLVCTSVPTFFLVELEKTAKSIVDMFWCQGIKPRTCTIQL